MLRVLFLSYALRSLLARFRANAVTLFCVSMFVMASSLALLVYVNIDRDISDSAPPENIIVLAKGADAEARSVIDRSVAANVTTLPGIRREGDLVLAAREQVSWVYVNKVRTRYEGPNVIRGISDASMAVHGLKVIEGRAPAEGTLEVMVGRRLQEYYPALKIGSQVSLPGGMSPIVGVFTGKTNSSELITPRSTLARHVNKDEVNSITLVAESPDRVRELLDTINNSKALDVKAVQTAEMLSRKVGLSKILRIVSILILLLGLTAIIAIMTTMNAGVAIRLPELAALVAIGIRRRRLAGMIVIECLLLAVVGALIGAGAAELVRQNVSLLPIPEAPPELGAELIAPVVSIAAGALSGLLASIAPALTVTRINVMETLR